jgi:putative cardiolipin synthase
MASRLVSLVVLLAAFLGGCVSAPPGADFVKTESYAIDRPEQTRLGRAFEAEARKHGGKSGFRLQPIGLDGFLARMHMINAAERTIDAQYYLFQEDDTGKLLTDAILRAADRGVRVRILLDDSVSRGQTRQIGALDGHPRIEIRLFNPFTYRGDDELVRAVEFMFNASRLDYRMHNKLFVVDNAAGIVGGRNIGDEYFQAHREFEFGDYDVFAIGPIVKRLSVSFDAYWNSAVAIPFEALKSAKPSALTLEEYRQALSEHRDRMQKTDYVRRLATGQPLAGLISGKLPLVWANAEAVYDSPDKANAENRETVGSLMRRPLTDTASALQSELLLVSPYFVPGERGVAFLSKLRKQGVRVRVLTNSLESTDVPAVHAGYKRYRVPLLEEGVELYEVRPILGKPKGGGASGSGGPLQADGAGRFALHAKVFVFDRRKLFIGSMNFDPRSLRLNTELALIIDSPELAGQVAKRFESIAQPANSYVLEVRPENAGAPRRLIWRAEEDGKKVEYKTEPARSAWQRMQVDFMSLLPLDDEL